MLVEAKDKVFCSYTWKLWRGSPSAKGLFRERRTFFIRAVSGAGLCRVRIPPLSAFNTRRRLSVKGAANELCRKLRMKLGGTTISSSHRIFVSYGTFCHVRGWWYYERQESHENKAYPCDHLLYHWVLRLWCSRICLLVIMERDYIRQARVSHLSAHMDSIILVQHIFLSACLQGEKRRLQAMGYQKKGNARFERHFNGA